MTARAMNIMNVNRVRESGSHDSRHCSSAPNGDLCRNFDNGLMVDDGMNGLYRWATRVERTIEGPGGPLWGRSRKWSAHPRKSNKFFSFKIQNLFLGLHNIKRLIPIMFRQLNMRPHQ